MVELTKSRQCCQAILCSWVDKRLQVQPTANRHAPTCAWLPIYFAPDCFLTALHCLTSNLFQSRTSSLISAPKAQIYIFSLDWYLNCIDSDTEESSWQEDISYICAQLFQFFSVCTGCSCSLVLSFSGVFHFYCVSAFCVFIFLYFAWFYIVSAFLSGCLLWVGLSSLIGFITNPCWPHHLHTQISLQYVLGILHLLLSDDKSAS